MRARVSWRLSKYTTGDLGAFAQAPELRAIFLGICLEGPNLRTLNYPCPVPVDLPPLQSGMLALVMRRLHADFRQRHGLPPVPSIDDDLDLARRRVVLNDASVLQSPRPVIGRAVERTRRVLWKTLKPVFGRAVEHTRRALWKILKPVFDRQTDMNRSLTRVLEALLAEREHHRHVHYDLSLRVAELERRLRLAEREHENRDREA